MSDLVMFVSKFFEIHVQYGIKATGVTPRLIRLDTMFDSCETINQIVSLETINQSLLSYFCYATLWRFLLIFRFTQP